MVYFVPLRLEPKPSLKKPSNYLKKGHYFASESNFSVLKRIMNLNSQINKIKEKLKSLFFYIRKHPVKASIYLAIIGFVLILSLFLSVYIGLFGHIPGKHELSKLENPITSTIYSSDKKEIATFYIQNRSNIDSSELNPYLTEALVATEDVRFYQHSGIDYKSYFRVLIKSIFMQQGKGGGSTITQQIAKNVFGRISIPVIGTPVNKIREIIIAKRLENIYTKDELILLYFNTVSFGENIYGIEMASQRFFSKKPLELNLSECATLVGVLKAPTYYSPKRNPINSERRRNVVLQQMVKNKNISQEEADKAKTPIELNYSAASKTSSLSGYYKDFIKKEFDAWAENNPDADGEIYNVETDGLQIYTSLNSSVQKSAEAVMSRNMLRLQELMEKHWASKSTEGGKEAFIAKLIEKQKVVASFKEQGKSQEEIESYLNQVKPRGYWQIGEGFELREMSFQDSLINEIIRLHTGVLAVNSRSGAIMGYVGGIDYGFSQYDNITTPKQVGSTFKPITFLAALEQGVDPCDYYDNSLRTYKQYEDWQPKNANGKYGGSYSVHGALANSINTVSVAIQLQVGVPKVKVLAKKMGITSPIPDVPSIVLGTADISLMEMVTAYASISNGGNKISPYIIQKIMDKDGKVLYEAKPKYEDRVASEASVKKLQQMMGEVISSGTAGSFNRYGVPYNIIGKTGTTQNNGDGWFIGCSPEVVVGAWVGTFDRRVHFESTYLGSGANTAMPMVATVFHSLSSWTKPMLTNFEYENYYFPCPMYSDTSATIATEFYKTDSTYLLQFLMPDSLTLEVDSLTLDSLEAIIPKQDSVIVE